jgi:methylmalonyl-CoA/ethylmalonyl-CoA epimerase
MQLDHIGIAVEDITESNKLFTKLLGKPPIKEEMVASQQVKVSFFDSGESKLELLQPTGQESPIAKFLAKNKPGVHHIAFKVMDVHSAAKEMEAAGFEVITKPPKKGADNKLVVFLHPKTTNGVLVELCQEIK